MNESIEFSLLCPYGVFTLCDKNFKQRNNLRDFKEILWKGRQHSRSLQDCYQLIVLRFEIEIEFGFDPLEMNLRLVCHACQQLAEDNVTSAEASSFYKSLWGFPFSHSSLQYVHFASCRLLLSSRSAVVRKPCHRTPCLEFGWIHVKLIDSLVTIVKRSMWEEVGNWRWRLETPSQRLCPLAPRAPPLFWPFGCVGCDARCGRTPVRRTLVRAHNLT